MAQATLSTGTRCHLVLNIKKPRLVPGFWIDQKFENSLLIVILVFVNFFKLGINHIVGCSLS